MLTQTLADIEILLIDDCSYMGSGMICDEYARKYSRVKVFHSLNGGVAEAHTMWFGPCMWRICHPCRSGPWVESDMLQSLYEKAVEEDADMVICDFYYEIDETEGYVRVCQQPETLDHMTVLKKPVPNTAWQLLEQSLTKGLLQQV